MSSISMPYFTDRVTDIINNSTSTPVVSVDLASGLQLDPNLNQMEFKDKPEVRESKDLDGLALIIDADAKTGYYDFLTKTTYDQMIKYSPRRSGKLTGIV